MDAMHRNTTKELLKALKNHQEDKPPQNLGEEWYAWREMDMALRELIGLRLVTEAMGEDT